MCLEHAELSRLVSDSANRLALADELYSAYLITLECYNSATDNSSKTDQEKGRLLMKGLMSTINSQPQLLTKLIDFLRKVEAFKSVAEKMQHDLSYIPNEVVVTSFNKEISSTTSTNETVTIATNTGPLSSEIAKRALDQCTNIIVKSNIDPFDLAIKAYPKGIISEDVYKIVKDKKTGDTSAERLDKILDDIKDRIKYDPNVLVTFLSILRDDSLSRNDLADQIVSKLN